MIEVKFKLLTPTAKAPSQSDPDDSGWDLYVSEDVDVWDTPTLIKTGVAVELPPGWEIQVRPRSSAAMKRNLHVVFGTVDNGYRGEIGLIAWLQLPHTAQAPLRLKIGDRVGQVCVCPTYRVRWTQADELSGSARGTNAYGSSGK